MQTLGILHIPTSPPNLPRPANVAQTATWGPTLQFPQPGQLPSLKTRTRHWPECWEETRPPGTPCTKHTRAHGGSRGRALRAAEGNQKEARTEFTLRYRSTLIENAIYTASACDDFKVSQEDGMEHPAGSWLLFASSSASIPQHPPGGPGKGARASSDPCRSNRPSVPGSGSQVCGVSSKRGALLQRGGRCRARADGRVADAEDSARWAFLLPASRPACLPEGSSGHRYLPGQPANIRPRLQTHEDIRSWEPYLVYAFGVFQPRIVHFFHIVGTSPTEEGLSSNGGGKAPNLPQRPSCCWSVL